MKLGPYAVDVPVMLAPMAGMSDLPYREICRAHGAGYAVGEMTTCQPQFRTSRKSATRWACDAELGLRVVQLLGADPAMMADAARYAEDSGAQVVDINMGCPMAKVVSNGDGSALMKDIPLAARIVEAVAHAVPVPVTVKCRLGWDRGSINVVELAQAVEAAGAQAIAVHGRTRTMLYSGVADWDTIRKVKAAVSIPVIANGDVFSGEAALQCQKRSGADLIMLGRGVFGDPWLFQEVAAALAGQATPPRPPLASRVDTAVEQFRLAEQDKGEHIACLEARKHFAWYLRGVPYSGYYKEKISHISTMADILDIAAGVKRDLR